MQRNPRSVDVGRQVTDPCRIAEPLSRRLREARAGLSLRWLERISARVAMGPDEVFPTQDLLNHVPLLIDAIARYLADPTAEGPNADRVIGKAAELGQIRFEQGFSPYQILKEFEILGSILLSFLTRESDELAMECPPGEMFVCAHRVHHALSLIQQVTAARYLALLDAFAGEREQRLRGVHELLTGRVRERLEALLESARRAEAAPQGEAAVETLQSLEAELERIQLLSTVRRSSRMQRNVPLRAVVGEASRVVRELARERGVEIRVADDLPEIEVNASTVELCLIAFLTAAIKHAAGEERERWVEIGGAVEGDDLFRRLVVRVRDNGIVPLDERAALFRPFLEPDETVTEETPAGVGLSLVKEAVEALGGQAWIEDSSDPDGAAFCFELPSRRLADD